MGLTYHPRLVPKVLEKIRAVPVLTLRACVAYKKGENLPIVTSLLDFLSKYDYFHIHMHFVILYGSTE